MYSSDMQPIIIGVILYTMKIFLLVLGGFFLNVSLPQIL